MVCLHDLKLRVIHYMENNIWIILIKIEGSFLREKIRYVDNRISTTTSTS